MSKQLLFDFYINRDNNTISIKKEYENELSKVWEAWTNSKILDKWWGPKPWNAETKVLDFREGGYWLYSMNGPEGEKQWGKFEFITIYPNVSFYGKDAFCDENWNLDIQLPINTWKIQFTHKGNIVLVDIVLKFDNTQDIDTYVNTGFQEGITQSLYQLEELLDNI